MTQHKRDTYVDGQEVIERAIDYLEHVSALLAEERQRGHGERVQMLLDSVESEQRSLLASVERYLEDAPGKVLHTYAQYIKDLPEDLEPPEQPLDGLGLLQWVQHANNRLYEEFEELASNVDADAPREAFGSIAQQIQSHERRLSKEFQRFQDL
ncbi:MAG: hypothetical protein ACODAC_08950 [Pseudomonadota bacterium]